VLTTIIIGLVTSTIGSTVGVAIALHFDLAGYWEQKHIERGRRRERKSLDK
jgi:hypothetical protein